jgi:hypothetical protein
MTMFQRALRYLGLDRETRSIRRMVKKNFTQAEEALDRISERLADSRRGVAKTRELSRAIRDSEFDLGKQRRRAVRA